MTQHTRLLESPEPIADSTSSRNPAPVLIQVPKLIVPLRIDGRTRQPARRGRRRLRREVRVAISAMAFALPMSWAMVTFGRFGPGPGAEPERPAAMTVSIPAPAEEPPLATLSLDTGVTLAAPEAERPAVLPKGFIVPDDRAEGTDHAGN